MASEVLTSAGFTGEALAIALGVTYAEADGPKATALFGVRSAYSDAVGDIGLISDKWGPSIGLFQVRSLRDPNAWGIEDRVRIAEKLRDPQFNAGAAWIISKHGTDWSKWSTFVHGTYLPYKGLDFEVRTGHPQAEKWSI